MDFDHDNARQVVEEDRLSSLPDELIHKILSYCDMQFAVQTCLLSSRWEFLWTSMSCLNFRSWRFGSTPKFANFVTHVLSHRNHQKEISSIKLHFEGEANQAFVRNIANYAFSRNVQELDVSSSADGDIAIYPPCLFSSQSLKHFRLQAYPCIKPKTPWDFPVLTTLHLSHIELCGDLFSKCVNLTDLTLERFRAADVDVLNIITPRLSNLMLINGTFPKVINLIAPQLENLRITTCSIKYSYGSSLCFSDYLPPLLSKDRFHSLNNVTVLSSDYCEENAYNEEDARKTINLLQQLHSARYLTLNTEIVECISSFPDLLMHHPSPFSNLICLTLESKKEEDACQVNMSAQAMNFLLGNSPSAKFIMKLPKVQRRSGWGF